MVCLERNRPGLAGIILQKDLHAALGRIQRGVAESRQLDSLFEQFQRRVQGELPPFQLLDNLLKPLERCLKIGWGRIIGSFRHSGNFNRYNKQRAMKILSALLVPPLIVSIFATACSPKAPPPERATVNAEHSSLRARDSATSRTLKVLEPGTHVEILERRGRWYRVRLDDLEGWMEVSTLLTDSMRDHIQENVNSALNQMPQNTGVLAQDANLRVDPGRDTSILKRLRAQTAVEVLDRRTIARDDPAARPDAWLKVRTSPTEVGWLLASFVEFDVPEGIAPYTEEFVYSAVKVLHEIDDPVAGTIRWYVVGERRAGADPNFDFTSIRVFTWNKSKQRYETAFRMYPKREIRGVYPLEVTQTPEGPAFRVYELGEDGKTKAPRNFTMTGVVVREAKKSG
jgi:hypothetical protein